jgi:hypothetical protein
MVRLVALNKLFSLSAKSNNLRNAALTMDVKSFLTYIFSRPESDHFLYF